MKKLCKILLLCVISITLFCAFGKAAVEQNKVLAVDYLNATDFKVIEIDNDTPSTKYQMENMLGVDQLTSKGDIYWDSNELTLILRDVSIFQIEDPLLFDEEGRRLSLINLNIDLDYSSDVVKVIIIQENEITCYGTAFTFLGNTEYQIISNGSSNREDVLHIHNRNCYDGSVLPAIDFANNTAEAIIGNARGILTLTLSGVGGIKGDDQLLSICGKTNLFLNAASENDFYESTDPDNYLSFEDEEENKQSVIYGFYDLNISSTDSNYKVAEEGYDYDAEAKALKYQEPDSEKEAILASKYYLGKFRKVSTFKDYEYLLNLKPEDQGDGYVNILLTKDVEYEIYESDLDRDAVIVSVRGFKRIFLNGHKAIINYNDNSDSDQNAIFYSVVGMAYNVPTVLDIFGVMSETEETSKIEAVFDGSSKVFSLFSVGSYSTLNIMDDVILGMHEDIVGTNHEYDGNVLMVAYSGVCNMYRGQLYGSDTYKDQDSTALAFIVSFITLGIGTAFPWGSYGYRGVVCNEQDTEHVHFRMVSGIVRSFDGRVIYTKNATSDAFPWRYYGGQLKSVDAAGLFGYGYYNNKLIDGEVLYGQFPNLRQIVYVENGNNYLGNTANMDEEAYQNGNYMYQGKEFTDYNGICQVSQMLDMVNADSIRYINPYYAPYIDQDLPDDIYVSTDSADMTGYAVTLFNLKEGIEDATMSKGYNARLFVQLPGEESIMQWNSALGNVEAGIPPLNSLGYTWKDGQLILVVRSSFPQDYDGTKVFFVIENNYLHTTVASNVATIHATEGITEPVIELTAPADCFNKEPNDGYIMEMGKNNHGVNVKAVIRSAYTDHVTVQWWDVTSHEAASGKQVLQLGDLDDNGLHIGSISFAPPVGSTKEGTHDYELWVWTYSKYGDQTIILTTSEKVRFTVEASIPEVASVTPANELNLLVGDEGTIEIELGDRVPENLVGFKWYYYPTYDHMVGIDGVNSENISIGTMIPLLTSQRAILTTNGYHNKLVYNLESYLSLGETYRIVYNHAGDIPGRMINTAVNISDGNKNINLVDFSYQEISGLYQYAQEFTYEVFDSQTLFIDPDYCTFTIDFSKTALNANHYLEDFYLQQLNEDGNWVTIKDLNPYLFGKNYLDVFEITDNNQATLSLTGNMDWDGYYVYCKVYNKSDSTKYTYTNPVKVNVGNRPVQPHFVDHTDYIYKIEDLYNEVLSSRFVETPYLNNKKVVEYQYQYQKVVPGYDSDGNPYYQYITVDDLEDYGILVTTRDTPSGETEIGVRMNSWIQAKGLYNYAFRVIITAYSPDETSLTDEVYTYFYWEYTEDDDAAAITDIEFYNYNNKQTYSYGNTLDGISRYKSKNGSLDIKDILFLTDDTAVKFEINLDTRNDNYDFNYPLNQDTFKLFVYRMIEGVQTEMPLDEFLRNTDAGEYIQYYEDYEGWIWFYRPFEDGMQVEIPFEYQNIVIFGKYYHNDHIYRTENWQISYLDMSSLGNPSFEDSDFSFELNPESGDIEINVGVITLPYNGMMYPNVDLTQAPLLAVDTGYYTAAADLSASGSLEAYGLHYVENHIDYDYDQEKYITNYHKTSNASELEFNESVAPNKFVTKIIIPYQDAIRLYEYYYEDGDNLFTSNELENRYSKFVRGDASVEAFQDEFTEDERNELFLCWYVDYMYFGGYMNIKINNQYVGYYYDIDYSCIKYEDALKTLVAYGLEDGFNYQNGMPETKYIKVVVGSERWIGDAAPVMEGVTYHWYLNEEPIEGAPTDDYYYRADTSSLTAEPLIYTLKYEINYLSGEKKLPYYYYHYYVVDVIPDIKNPTIISLENVEVEYLDPTFKLEVEANIPDKTNEKMIYHWTVDGNQYYTDVPYLSYLPKRLGNIAYSCEVISYLEYEVDGETRCESGSSPASLNRTITVNKRNIVAVDLSVEEPRVGANPSNSVTPIPTIEGDTYIGYKVVSAYWDIPSNETFELGEDYTLTAIIEILDNANFAPAVSATFNGSNQATATAINATQYRVSYVFTGEAANLLNNINITIPEFGPNSMIRKVDPVEADTYKLVNSSWNSNDEYLSVNKEYKLTLNIKLDNKYYFDNTSKVYVNGSEVNYQLNGKNVKVTISYLYAYSALVRIGEKESRHLADENSEISLLITGDDTPAGYRFKGWYNGETLITDATNAKYKIFDNDQVIDARFERSSYTVSFNANGGTGEMTSVNAPIGTFTLPKAKFTAPSGKVFKGWEVDGNLLEAGDQIEITKDVTLKAIWIDAKEDGSNPTPSTNPNEGNNSSGESTPAVQNKSNTGLIVVIIILSMVILAGAGFGVYYFFLRKNKPTAPSSDTKPKE